MVIGSSTGSKSYGRLVMDFKSEITFLGGGITTFKRGETLFASGKVGIGSRSAGGAHGVTIATAAKPGDKRNDLAVKRGSVHLHGGLYDISSKGKWYLDLDKGGHMKALNVAS